MAEYGLAPAVLDDIDQLSAPGLEFMVRRRKVRRFPFGAHVTIYADTAMGVRILRVLHSRTDWRRELRRTGI